MRCWSAPAADLMDTIGLPLPSRVICEMLGVPFSGHRGFHALSKVGLSRKSTSAEAVNAVEQMLEVMRGLIDERKSRPQDDLISRLVESQFRTGKMTRDELAMLCRTLFVAGHETTGNMIALGTVALLQNPDVLAEIQATNDPQVIANAVEELLRWLTILHVGRRRVALEDIVVAGKQIKAGDGIIIAHDIANRDPGAFADPERLDIHRDARQHLAFGYGIHQCLGQPLARVELQVVCSTLYRRIPTLALAMDFDDLPFKHENVVYGVHELPVTW